MEHQQLFVQELLHQQQHSGDDYEALWDSMPDCSVHEGLFYNIMMMT